jgi:hypothetical protein
MDDLTDQAIDMFLKNDAVQDRVIKPMKRRAVPFILTGVAFNLLLLALVVYLIFQVQGLNTKIMVHGND